MNFTYVALRPDGTLSRHRGEYSGLEALLEDLEERQLILLKFRRQRIPALEDLRDRLLPPVKRADIVELCDSLATMLGSGIALIEALKDLEASVGNRRLAKALANIIRAVEAGERLSEAFARHARTFPDIMIFFLSIGEETGTMQQALENTAAHLRRVDEIVSQTKRALIYPAFVMSAMGGVLFFWLFFVMPRLVATFHDMDLQLPDITLTLVAFVNLVKNHGLLLLVILMAALAFLALLLRYERTRTLLAGLGLRLPVVGTLLRYANQTILFSNLGLMLRSGVTMTQSFEVLEATLSNPVLRRIISRIREATTGGDSLLEAFTQSRFFDPLALRMISVGESTGTLDQRLSALADTYHDRTTRFVEVMGKMVEPLVMAVAGGIFVFIVISLIGPVYDLISQLGGG